MKHPQQPDSKVNIQELYELVHEQSATINNLKKQLSTQIEKKILNSTKQLEASQALQGLIGDTSGRLGCLNGYLLSPEHGFPISPDFAVNLVRLIRDQKYDLIIEFGSGTSTLLCLKAFESFNLYPKQEAESSPLLITYEHLEEYHQKTNRLVKNCFNHSLLDLRLSPLTPWNQAGNDFIYYSNTSLISEAINALETNINTPNRVLVIIDGPPGNTCHWARYPAVPIVLDAASGMDISIDFLLDDMIRTDEKEMAMAWEERIKAFGLSYERIDYNFEKGGMLLTLNSLAGTDTSLVRSEELASERQELEAISSAITQVDELLAELKQVKELASSEKEEAQQQVSELNQQLEATGGQLQKVVAERDARAKEKSDAQKAVEELRKQLETKGTELQGVVSERDAQSKEKAEAQQQVADLKQKLNAKGAELQKVVSERDAGAKEKEEAQKSTEELRKQLETKETELQGVVSERDARAKEKGEAQQAVEELKQQLKAKAVELKSLVADRDARAKEKGETHQQVAELRKQLERERKQLEAQSSTLLLLQKSLKIKESELQELQDDFHTMRLRHLRQRSR